MQSASLSGMHDADRRRLLPDRQMHRAVAQAADVGIFRRLLEAPDAVHAPQGVEHLVARQPVVDLGRLALTRGGLRHVASMDGLTACPRLDPLGAFLNFCLAKTAKVQSPTRALFRLYLRVFPHPWLGLIGNVNNSSAQIGDKFPSNQLAGSRISRQSDRAREGTTMTTVVSKSLLLGSICAAAMTVAGIAGAEEVKNSTGSMAATARSRRSRRSSSTRRRRTRANFLQTNGNYAQTRFYPEGRSIAATWRVCTRPGYSRPRSWNRWRPRRSSSTA